MRHRGPVAQPPKRNEEYTRRVYVRDGYDCRNGNCPSCATGKRADHGVCGEHWYFSAIRPEGAITLSVLTPHYPATVTPSPTDAYVASGLSVCLAWATSRETIARGASPDSCPYIGQCYPADAITRDDTFFKEHFDAAVGKQQPESFWAALHQLLLASMDDAAPAKHLHQCAHCQGTGVAASR